MIGAGTIRDLAGNNFAGITNSSAFSFSTAGASSAIDAGNSAATASSIVLGQTRAESVGVGADTNDFFRFTAASSGTVQVSLTGLRADLDIKVLDSSQSAIAAGAVSGVAPEILSFEVVAGRTYYLQVEPYRGVSSPYLLSTGYWTESVGVAMPVRSFIGVTQGYSGETSHSPASGIWEWGVDFDIVIDTNASAVSDDIISVGSGTVVSVRSNSSGQGDSNASGFGNFVTILHSEGFYATYAHLRAVSVSVGQTVSTGQKLGDGGNTGITRSNGGDGSHLHIHFGTEIAPTAGFFIADGSNDDWPPAFFESFASQAEVAGLVNPASSASIQPNDIFGSSDATDPDSDDDQLTGNSAANRIFGLSGNDRLDGAAGNDIIVGGSGKDRMTGGSGADDFVISSVEFSRPGTSGRDVINDFVSGSDDLDISGIDANTTSSGNQQFAFSGNRAAENSVWVVAANTSDLLVRGDNNGDGVYDFEIYLFGISNLVAGDFIL